MQEFEYFVTPVHGGDGWERNHKTPELYQLKTRRLEEERTP